MTAASSKPRPKKKAATIAAIKAMDNRATRRLNKADLVNQSSELKIATEGTGPFSAVLRMLDEHKVPLRAFNEQPLQFAKQRAASGVQQGLALLVHDPSALKVDLTTPWCGWELSENTVRRLLNGLVIPKWAMRLKTNVVESISKPNVLGMLNPDGTPNKDLKQLLTVFRGVHELPADVESARVESVREIAQDILAFLSDRQDEFFTVITNSRGEKRIRLKMWTQEQFEQQMAKAIKSSSPGYPYNGCKWQENIEGYTCIEHAWRACEALVANDAVLPGFVFIQQSRATGDGGALDETNSGGRQRLVMAAPNNEKLIGHILAYVFKLYARKSPFSGQRGIQEVSRNIKRECQSLISAPDVVTEDYWVCDYDVSDWDAAQLHAVMDSDFFTVCDLVFDDEDEFTICVNSNYRTMYKKSVLNTAFGEIETEFLPSGSSITTASAFINHEVKTRCVDKLVVAKRGYPLFHIVGFQGDDNASIVHKPTDEAMEILKHVYGSYHCQIKGSVHLACLAENDAALVFLNEAIRVRDDVENYTNAKFPRWNLFWAENYRDNARGPNIDRMLLEEITRSVPHPTATELTFVSFVSKMDRFINMPFYTALLNWIRPRGAYPMRSWLGERVCPKSETLQRIKLLEEAEGIFWPAEQQRALDRREEFWANKDELSQMMMALALLVPVSPEARTCANTIVAKAKNSEAWKRARSAMELAGVDFDTEAGKIPLQEARELLSLAFELGYSSTPQEVTQVVELVAEPDEDIIIEMTGTVKKDKFPSERTIMRGLLGLNDDDPYQLRQLYAEAIISAYGTPAWRSLPIDAADELVASFKAMYGQNPDGEPDIDWLNG